MEIYVMKLKYLIIYNNALSYMIPLKCPWYMRYMTVVDWKKIKMTTRFLVPFYELSLA